MAIVVTSVINNHSSENGLNMDEPVAGVKARDHIPYIEIVSHWKDDTLVNIDVFGTRVTVKASELHAAVSNATNTGMENGIF